MNTLSLATFIQDRLSNGECSVGCGCLWSAETEIALGNLLQTSSLFSDPGQLSGRSILLLTRDQLAAALALFALDGIASRIIICPPETTPELIPSLVQRGNVDTIVSDYELRDEDCPEGLLRIACGTTLLPVGLPRHNFRATEWVLLTSGTTGVPKMIVHDLASLTAPIRVPTAPATIVWGTFYDIRRYGGMQILLRAVIGCGSLVLSEAGENPASHLIRLAEHGVTHLSGTPSHWRRALMSGEARRISPRYIRLSGEIADQPILNTLNSFYPEATVSHAFASTEAGVAFEVNDGRAGFPATLLAGHDDVEMKVCNESLRIRSNRASSRYLGEESGPISDSEGFVDTGDVVELRNDRYYFLGRRNGVINVGGLKVYPEEVEATINRHPAVQMSAVRPRKNSLTGAVVSAEVVLKEAAEADVSNHQRAAIKAEIIELCQRNLAQHKVPVSLRYVSSLGVAAAGKLIRSHA